MNVDPAQEPSPANLPPEAPADPVVDTSELSSIDRAQAAIAAVAKRMEAQAPESGEVPPAAPPVDTDPPPSVPPAAEQPKMVKLKVDGREIEVPEAEVPNLAQMGLDYTRKSMALAEERKKMEAWNVLHERIQTDPQFAAHVFGYGQQPPQQTPKGDAPPADPIEQLLLEAERRAEQKLAPVIQQMGQKLGMTEQQVVIAQTRQAIQSDPLYAEVMPLVHQYVQGQPTPALQQQAFQALDRDPSAFVEVYGAFRS